MRRKNLESFPKVETACRRPPLQSFDTEAIDELHSSMASC